MLKTDRLEKFNWTGRRSIDIIVNNEYNTVKVGDYFFPCVEDLNRFINLLSDISESLEEDKEDEEDEV
jgi:hypothetical protein